MTTTETPKAPRELHAAGIMTSGRFIPETAWEQLEEARVRHGRALNATRDARREEALAANRHRVERTQETKAAAARVLNGEPAEDAVAREDARARELSAIGVRIQAAREAQHQAVYEALVLVEQHPEWAEQIAGRRAVALAEHEDLVAKAQAAKVRAHAEDHLHRWLVQAATKASPQPYAEAGPVPPPAQTVAEVFGGMPSTYAGASTASYRDDDPDAAA